MKTVWVCFENQTFDWINSDKKIQAILQKKLSDEDDKKTFKKLICEKYSVEKKSIVKQSVAIKIIHMQQDQNEIIKKYYLRIHDALVAIDDMNILLSSIIWHWINELNNKKLFAHLISRFIDQSSLYNVCTIAERKFQQKKKRRLQKKKERRRHKMILQQQLQKFVDRDLVDDVSIAQSQKFYESSYVLKKISFKISEINTIIVNSNDIEIIDEIFAFESDKWIVVFAKKKIFCYINTFDEVVKNSFAFDIEVSNISFDWSRCCIVDDVKILNQKIFALIVLYDAFLKNSLVENKKISIVMNMSSLKHLMNMNDFAIETFDFDITLDASLKNSLIQHIENSKTWRRIQFTSTNFLHFSLSISALILTSTFIHSISSQSIKLLSCFLDESCNYHRFVILHYATSHLTEIVAVLILLTFASFRFLFALLSLLMSFLFQLLFLLNALRSLLRIRTSVRRNNLFALLLILIVLLLIVLLYRLLLNALLARIRTSMRRSSLSASLLMILLMLFVLLLILLCLLMHSYWSLIWSSLRITLFERHLWILLSIWFRNQSTKDYRRWKSRVIRVETYRFKKYNRCWNICTIRIQNNFVLEHFNND